MENLLLDKQQTISNSDKENILQCWNDWESKARSGDPAYYWTNDVLIMSPDGTVRGKEDFLKLFSFMLQNQITISWDQPSEIEISQDGQMAYLIAKNKTQNIDSTGIIHTKTNQALQIWKKDKAGNWKAAVNVMYAVE